MEANTEEKYTFTKDESDPLKDKYGILPFIQSATDPEHRFQVKFTKICEINSSLDGQMVKLRVRLQRSRIKGKSGFLVLREGVIQFKLVFSLKKEKYLSKWLISLNL